MKNRTLIQGRPPKIFQHKEPDHTVKWVSGKMKKSCVYDDIIDEAKRESRQPPNQYFKTEKGDFVRMPRYNTKEMFSTKKHEIGKVKAMNFVDEVVKHEKTKIGPNHYKNMYSDNRSVC